MIRTCTLLVTVYMGLGTFYYDLMTMSPQDLKKVISISSYSVSKFMWNEHSVKLIEGLVYFGRHWKGT